MHHILTCGEPNKNGRIYPLDVVKQAVDRFSQVIEHKEALGELGMTGDSTIRFADVSHSIDRMWLEGNELFAEIKPLNTPKGKILQEMLDKDEVAFRLKGVGGGKVDKDANFIVGPSYKIIAVSALPKDEAS